MFIEKESTFKSPYLSAILELSKPEPNTKLLNQYIKDTIKYKINEKGVIEGLLDAISYYCNRYPNSKVMDSIDISQAQEQINNLIPRRRLVIYGMLRTDSPSLLQKTLDIISSDEKLHEKYGSILIDRVLALSKPRRGLDENMRGELLSTFAKWDRIEDVAPGKRPRKHFYEAIRKHGAFSLDCLDDDVVGTPGAEVVDSKVKKAEKKRQK